MTSDFSVSKLTNHAWKLRCASRVHIFVGAHLSDLVVCCQHGHASLCVRAFINSNRTAGTITAGTITVDKGITFLGKNRQSSLHIRRDGI